MSYILISGVKSSRPSVLIRPLRTRSGDPELDFWGIGLATELADELNRYPDIRVMTLGSPDDPNTAADQRAVRFVGDGRVRSDGVCIKMILKLTDTRTDHQIWSESSRSSIEVAAELLKLKPDYAARGRILIGHYIKFEDIVERVIKGLNAVSAWRWGAEYMQGV